MSHKITPFIRCVDNAQQVAEYYGSIFPDAKIIKSNPVVVDMEIFGQSIAMLNGGSNDGATLTPAISFSLWVRDIELTKEIWDKLSDGGTVMMAYDAYPRSKAYGRCNDKFGVSRQVMYDDCAEHATHQLIPSLMFIGANDGKAQEAMSKYISIFPASTQWAIHTYGDMGGPDKPDHIAHAEFTLVNQLFIAMDSWLDHKFNFTDGISLAISCADQAEIDMYREKLALDGGSEGQCGRCKDKYGVSRQIFPVRLPDALFQEDKVKADFAMQAMIKMKKIVIADLYQK